MVLRGWSRFFVEGCISRKVYRFHNHKREMFNIFSDGLTEKQISNFIPKTNLLKKSRKTSTKRASSPSLQSFEEKWFEKASVEVVGVPKAFMESITVAAPTVRAGRTSNMHCIRINLLLVHPMFPFFGACPRSQES